MMASLGHSIKQGKFNTLSGAYRAMGQAILSGAITIVIGSIRAQFGKILNYNSVKQMITKIGINRAIRGGLRVSLGWGWAKINILIN